MSLIVNREKLPARQSLLDAMEVAWQRLAEPGTWWSGPERIAIAAAVRDAPTCRLCQQRKVALSPYGQSGVHDGGYGLTAQALEAAHRITTDASRISRRWVEEITHAGLGEERYVEIVSIVATVTALDTFDDALGRPRRPLPTPKGGEPTRHRPRGTRRDLAWVSTLAPEQVLPGDPNPYPAHGDKNIHRALSLVPQEVINFFDLDVELYLKDHEIRDFSTEYRAISHSQIELIAARASVLNRCYY